MIELTDSHEDDHSLVGKVFEDRFQILSVLGKGGGGVVYKAKHTHMDKLVAIKMLVSSVVHDELSFLRFKQEAKAAAALDHPNIITIHDSGKSIDGQAYLVMEFLNGPSLEDTLKFEKRLDVDRFVSVFGQVCDGLQHAHRNGVVHRDIKPSNIMLVDKHENFSQAKVVDFGLAKLTAQESEQHLTKTGIVMGTPLFMSPEQCRGAEIDHRSDVYSLGCVMYAALTGQVPHKGDSTLSTLYKHMAETPAPFSVVAAELSLPPSLEAVIFKALNKDPDQRQQSMSELRNSISDAVYAWHHPTKPGDKTVSVLRESQRVTKNKLRDDDSPTVNITVPPNAPLALEPTQISPSLRPPTGRSKQNTKSNHRLKVIVLFLIGATAVCALALGSGSNWLSSPYTKGHEETKQIAINQDLNAPNLTNKSKLLPSPLVAISSTDGEITQSSAKLKSVPNSKTKTVDETREHSSGKSDARKNPELLTASKSKPAREFTEEQKHFKDAKLSLAKDHDFPQKALTKQASPSVAHKPKQEIAYLPSPPPSEDQLETRREMLNQAHVIQRQANDSFNSGDPGTAMNLFAQCLAIETKVWGKGDPHLFPAKINIISCLMRSHNTAQLKPHLKEALDMFSKHGKQIVPIIAQTKDPTGLWRSIARSSSVVAKQSQGADRNLYCGWSADFYQLAILAWGGSTSDDEYVKLIQERAAVLSMRNSPTAARVTQPLNTKVNQPQSAPPALKKPHKKHLGKGIREY